MQHKIYGRLVLVRSTRTDPMTDAHWLALMEDAQRVAASYRGDTRILCATEGYGPDARVRGLLESSFAQLLPRIAILPCDALSRAVAIVLKWRISHAVSVCDSLEQAFAYLELTPEEMGWIYGEVSGLSSTS